MAETLGNSGKADITLPPRFLDVLAEMYDELMHMDEWLVPHAAFTER